MGENIFKPSKSEKRGLKLLHPSMTNILSVGISTGGYAEINMAKKCPNAKIIATTIDEKGLLFSLEKISQYKEGSRIEAKIEDVSKPMPYPDNTFDYVYARLVLHYLTKQQLDAALNEIYRVLKPGGIIFVVARNNKEWELKKPEFIISYDKTTNITTYYEQWKKEVIRKRQFLSEEQLKNVLVSHNFKIKSAKSYKERLCTDYERTKKYLSKKPNFLTEVVAIKNIMGENMNQSREYTEFLQNYLNNKCEGPLLKLTVLTGFNVKGAGKSRDFDYYTQHITCLAYMEGNNVINEQLHLLYFLDKDAPFLDTNNLTPYTFLVKKIKDSDRYCIAEFCGLSSTTAFDAIIEEQSKPLIIADGEDSFEFNRTFNSYDGSVVIENKKIKVSLYPERKTTDATESLNTFGIIKHNFRNFYHTVLQRCANDMVQLANEWREEGDTHEITEEEIYKRIDTNSFEMDIRKTEYTIYLNDDNLFYGHTILHEGSFKTGRYSSTIAG